MTPEGYRYLKDGMAKFEVDMALDVEGEEQSKSGSLTTYVWRDGYKTVIATFQNGRLVSKLQSGM